MTLYIGPIAFSSHTNPTFQWGAEASARGMRSCSIGGFASWDQGKQLQELADNPARLVTIGDASGVLEPIWPDDDRLADYRGWYLLHHCDVSPSSGDEEGDNPVPFALTATRLPDGLASVVTRSARARSNDFDLAPVALVATPFRHEDADGGDFLTSPGGVRFARAYDSAPYDPRRIVPDADKLRALAIRAGALAPSDPLARVTTPSLDTSGTGVPPWVTDRGGDCRAYDRRSMREVFGPGHPFVATTDCVVTNGLVAGWIGNRGLHPFISTRALAGDGYHEVGVIPIGTNAPLVGARIATLSPDAITLALTVEGEGDVFVTLKRGERMFRCQSPTPATAPGWRGLLPTSRANAAQNGTGRFAKGLDAGGDEDDGSWLAPFPSWEGDARFRWDGSPYRPDLRLLWPPSVQPAALARALWYRPERSVSDLGTAGLLTLYAPNGVAVVEVYLDGADAKIKVRVNDEERLASEPHTFEADDDLLVGLRFSTDHGLGLSIRDQAGNVAHLIDDTLTELGVSELYDMAYFVNFSRWGDGSWGDDTWGGVTHYPGGVIGDDKLFDGWISEAEFETLAEATHHLDGLPSPLSRLVWHAPYEAAPLPVLSALTDGRRIDPVVDPAGFRKVVAHLDEDGLATGVLLARTGTYETPAAQHKQLAAASEQTVRVR